MNLSKPLENFRPESLLGEGGFGCVFKGWVEENGTAPVKPWIPASSMDYNAKLSDFGLAKDGPEGDKTHVSTRVMGTYGYAAPEYVMTGHFSIKGAQKAIQLAAHCLSRDPKARPMMSEVVEALKPLPNLKDMASSSYHFQTMQAARSRSTSNAKNGIRTQAVFVPRNGHPVRSLSSPNGPPASPYYPHKSPKPNSKG
ncbi:hypothetical protein GBA52_025474 [Prunus armeniaca]|nr:hypothetical protein GBA52_025474 [Prunus armeniaca]